MSLYPQGQFLRYPVDKTLCTPQNRSGRDGQKRKILSLMGIKLHRQELSHGFRRTSLRVPTEIVEYIHKNFKRNSKSLSKYCRKCPEIGNSGAISLGHQMPLRFLACVTFSQAEVPRNMKIILGVPRWQKGCRRQSG